MKHLAKQISMLVTNLLFVRPATSRWVRSNRHYWRMVFSLTISPHTNILRIRKSINLLLAFAFLSLFATSLAQEKEQILQQAPTPNNKQITGVSKEQQDAVSSLARQDGGTIAVSWDKANGTPTFFSGNIPSEKLLLKSNGSRQLMASDFLEENKIIFKLNTPGEELLLLQQQDDKLGMTHLKFNQVYKNIPVWASQLAVHFNKEGMIQSINGHYHPSFEISTTPSISKEKAISAAESNAKYKSENATADLYIYPKDGMFLLAWRVKLPSIAFPNMDIFIDATNASILTKDDGIRYQQKAHTQIEKQSVNAESLSAKVELVQLTIDGDNITENKLPNNLTRKTSSRLSKQTFLTSVPNWQTIMSEGFEQTFPGTTWSRKSTGINTVYWDTTTYKAHTGSKSLYCARSGNSGVNPSKDTLYPTNTYTVLRYGPFNLADADNASLTFSHWTITESGYDYFFVGASTDTNNFIGYNYSGNWTTAAGADVNGWQTVTLNLFDIAGPAQQVWIAFTFKSDAIYGYRGTFLDDFALNKSTLPNGLAALGSGIGLDGTTRQLNTALCGTDYNLIDVSRQMYIPPISSSNGVIATFDAQSDSTTFYARAVLVQDPNNDDNFNDNVQLRAAVDAHYYTGVVYNYYYNKFNRNSWNNNGGSLKSYIHVGNKYNNAFWNGLFMAYGDGDGITFSNFAGGLDVIGHEITHGVTESTANLLYENQSGALNESYSDCFGTFIEFYAKGQTGNWLIGEDIYTPGVLGDALRNMQNPHSGADWQPSHMSEYVELLNDGSNDGGGVHINSGIPNRACYLIGSTIGLQKTEQIYYRALTTYLTSTSQFLDARNATLQAASDLYGSSSAEYIAVESAFTAVGVTSDAARELIYDGGYPASFSYWSTSGAMYAVRMTPTVTPARISKLEYFIGGTFSGTRKFKVHILKDLSGTPGSDLIYPFSVTPAGDGWFTVNLSSYLSSYHTIVNGTFYVAMEYDGTNKPYLGLDTTSNGRGWSRSSSTANWTSRTNTYYVRAVVNAVPPAPSANFTASPVSGANPLPVSFANQSSGIILSYLWDFGDGYTSTQKNPAHTFTGNGAYNVKLIVTGPGGVHDTLKKGFVNVGGTGVKSNGNNLPQSFSLEQNYPNPFNPSTSISFSLPTESIVSLKVFDLLGREAATIINEVKSAGTYTATFNAVNIPSGVYFYRLHAGNFVETKRLVLLR